MLVAHMPRGCTLRREQAGGHGHQAAADRIRREAKPFERVRDEESGRKNAEHSPDLPDNAPWVPCPTTRVPATRAPAAPAAPSSAIRLAACG